MNRGSPPSMRAAWVVVRYAGGGPVCGAPSAAVATDRTFSTALARSLDRPVQFVVGESDPFVSAAELHEFDVREIPGAGHLVNVERPDEFNEILTEFLARV